uniref:Uncharacterized protein n=1 Tax=Rhizophora mucronata TaxID=61149 RepID=A0A2P2N0I9_RHIMU
MASSLEDSYYYSRGYLNNALISFLPISQHKCSSGEN